MRGTSVRSAFTTDFWRGVFVLTMQADRLTLFAKSVSKGEVIQPVSGDLVDSEKHSFDIGIAWMKAAGETTRLRLLALLDSAELTVTDLVDILEQSQPRISRHLKLLVEAGLAERFQEGTWAYFRTVNRGLARKFLDAVLLPLDGSDEQLAADVAKLEAIKADRARRADAYFAENAENWNKLRSLHVAEDQVESELLDMALAANPRTVLDLGTGTGRMLQLFAPHIERGMGIDMSPDMLSLARSALSTPETSHVQVRRGDIYNLEGEAEYDLILFHLVLHFLEEPDLAISAASKLLSDRGRMLIVDFAPHDLEFLQKEHAHRRLGIANQQMHRWFSDAGLAIEDVRTLKPIEDGDDMLTVQLWLAGR